MRFWGFPSQKGTRGGVREWEGGVLNPKRKALNTFLGTQAQTPQTRNPEGSFGLGLYRPFTPPSPTP